jgi:hypothetical protein
MNIPRNEIANKRKFVDRLDKIKNIHYRDLHTEIDWRNFQICTKADFKEIKKVPYYPLSWTWNELKEQHKAFYYHKSKTDSEYVISPQGKVYRYSNHWGAVASCEWTLDGTGQLAMSIHESGPWQIGVADLKDFEVFRRKDDRRRDMILNPEWERQIVKIIPLKKKLNGFKMSPEFKTIPIEDRKLIGQSYGKFAGCLKELKK